MIRVGIGGWTFEPWRGVFFPDKLPHARELAYAAERLTVIEVNGTFYRTQSPETFRKWAAETPDQFVFTLKAPRYATNRRVLAEAGPNIEKFVESGITELGAKLGPILWQFAPTKSFEVEDFSAFVRLLPQSAGGTVLRHAVEVRHDSFLTSAFTDLLREHNVAAVYAHHDAYPEIADPTADFIYARLQQTRPEVETGYSGPELDVWSERVRAWAEGGVPEGLPCLSDPPPRRPRDCFVFFISGAKVRAPAAAQALMARLGAEP